MTSISSLFGFLLVALALLWRRYHGVEGAAKGASPRLPAAHLMWIVTSGIGAQTHGMLADELYQVNEAPLSYLGEAETCAAGMGLLIGVCCRAFFPGAAQIRLGCITTQDLLCCRAQRMVPGQGPLGWAGGVWGVCGACNGVTAHLWRADAPARYGRCLSSASLHDMAFSGARCACALPYWTVMPNVLPQYQAGQ